jgi:hypothetical protein
MKLALSRVSSEQLAFCAAWFGVVALAGCSGFSLPNPPDMSALVEQYTHPDGYLDRDTVEEITRKIVERIQQSQGGAPIALSDELINSLGKLGNRPPATTGNGIGAGSGDSMTTDTVDAGAGTQSVLGNKINVGAVVKVHHICGGWYNRIDEDQNGSADLTVTFDQGGLIPTVWGELTHCRFLNLGSQVELDGEVNLRLGTDEARIGLKALKTIGYLVQFDGSASTTRSGKQISADGTASFRVFPTGVVQMNVNLSNGTNVLGVFDQGVLTTQVNQGTMLAAGIQGSDTSWACQFSAATLTGMCTNELDPSMVVKW